MNELRTQIKEFVIISGKGGTGKTSLTAAFAALANHPVIVDCDVDAADLHLILLPQIKKLYEFRSGHEATIRQEDCVKCGDCFQHCKFNAVQIEKKESEIKKFYINPLLCEGCGVCVRFCKAKAIDFSERLSGEWMISETRYGPMVHAQLGVAAENSGKLVSTVRHEARRIAEENGHSLIIIDGPPGIGCPVIASMTGTSLVLIVTEPTVSGEHDMERVISLAHHFNIPIAICINKWDINPEMADRIEKKACEIDKRIILAGRVRYDPSVTLAQMNSQTIIERQSPVADDIRNIWKNLNL